MVASRLLVLWFVSFQHPSRQSNRAHVDARIADDLTCEETNPGWGTVPNRGLVGPNRAFVDDPAWTNRRETGQFRVMQLALRRQKSRVRIPSRRRQILRQKSGSTFSKSVLCSIWPSRAGHTAIEDFGAGQPHPERGNANDCVFDGVLRRLNVSWLSLGPSQADKVPQPELSPD